MKLDINKPLDTSLFWQLDNAAGRKVYGFTSHWLHDNAGIRKLPSANDVSGEQEEQLCFSEWSVDVHDMRVFVGPVYHLLESTNMK